MPAYVVFMRERMRNQEAYDRYRPQARAALEGQPAKALVRYGRHETIEGAPIDGAVILEFPTFEAAQAWYNGPAYTKARQDRHLGGDYRAFIVEGL
jgi:uncharacterized protein (DUF1330 family)